MRWISRGRALHFFSPLVQSARIAGGEKCPKDTWFSASPGRSVAALLLQLCVFALPKSSDHTKRARLDLFEPSLQNEYRMCNLQDASEGGTECFHERSSPSFAKRPAATPL